jgi:hypothetical protein
MKYIMQSAKGKMNNEFIFVRGAFFIGGLALREREG